MPVLSTRPGKFCSISVQIFNFGVFGQGCVGVTQSVRGNCGSVSGCNAPLCRWKRQSSRPAPYPAARTAPPRARNQQLGLKGFRHRPRTIFAPSVVIRYRLSRFLTSSCDILPQHSNAVQHGQHTPHAFQAARCHARSGLSPMTTVYCPSKTRADFRTRDPVSGNTLPAHSSTKLRIQHIATEPSALTTPMPSRSLILSVNVPR